MKPAAFTYHTPSTVEEALALLASLEDGKVLAGGQSLVPAMAFRLARPSDLIDINGIDSLKRLEVVAGAGGAELVIGAGVRHAAFHKPVEPGPTGRLLSKVVRHIAHYPIRTRGTFCGSLANADPSSEWCLTAAALDATLVVRSATGSREMKTGDFFEGVMMTTLQGDEILVEVRLPLLPPDAKVGFYEVSRRAGDFGMAIALAAFRVVNGVIAEPRLGLGGAEDHPRRIPEAEAALLGRAPTVETFRAAAEAAAAAIEPLEDAQTTGAVRRRLVRAVVERALVGAE